MKPGIPSHTSKPGAVRTDTLFGLLGLVLLTALLGWMVFNPRSFQETSFMQFIQQFNLQYLAPEAIILIGILFCVFHLSFSKTKAERQETWLPATVATAAGLTCLVAHFALIYYQDGAWLNRSVFYGMFSADLFSLLVRMLLTFGTLLVLFFSRRFIDEHAEVPGEFYPIILSALLGGMMLSGATDLIMVFVSLETLSISSYILVAYLRGNVLSAEAGLKYLLYGGMATAILLFGFSLLYGLAGSTSYPAIAASLGGISGVEPIVMAIMTVMILGGIAFKLSAAPFHMWAPDAYEGAPTPVVAFLSVVSKIAAFSMALRFFVVLFGGPVQGWFGLLSILAVLSMVIGNVVALTQRNIKRLLAYSTVAHVGYLLLGLIIMTQSGLSSIVYYLATYLFMNLGAFAVVTQFENQTGRSDIAAYAGLVRKRPFQTLVFSIMLLSLAGIPITAGFFGKFFLFQAVANAGNQYLWLVIVALLTSTISLYYYLNVIRQMVIMEPSDAVAALPDKEVQAGAFNPVAVTMLLCLIGTILTGIFAQPLMLLSSEAVEEIGKSSLATVQTSPETLARQ